jgi:hemerythrin superfamily protein
MNAVELLMHDHRMVEQLFRDYDAAASPAQRRAVVEVLIRELSKHAALEELMVYPLARKLLADGGQEIDEHLAEHRGVKKLLLQLDKLGQDDPETGALMDQLQTEVADHIEQEEGHLLPRLRDLADTQALADLGEALDKGKHTAPTRPHPAAPTQPPALTLAAPVAAIYDRLRDRIQGRPKT